MNSYCRNIVAFFLGCITFARTQICDLDCGPGYRCALRLSTCDYPPCPSFPTCATVDNTPAWAEASHERPGQCPTSSFTSPCINSCTVDSDCPQSQKCCENDCGRSCRAIVTHAVEKPGTCARRLNSILGTCEHECENDMDCPGVQKCCRTNCAAICSDPCYYWLEPNQRTNRKSVIWKLPFICRI